MSTYPMMQPESYCTQCGAPMYQIFDRLCHTCHCSGIAPIEPYYSMARMTDAFAAETTAGTEPRMTYEGKCEHCGGSMWRNTRGSLHSCPITVRIDEEEDTIPLPSVKPPCEIEEINSDRASRIYQSIYRAIWKHEAECPDCELFARIDMICTEQALLWEALRFWGERIEDEATDEKAS